MEAGLTQDILKGVRVLDFTRVLAGPYATRVFADFGAEVIKVQPANRSSEGGGNNGAYFRTWNRNKRSITVNMNHPEAKGLIKRLVQVCDILVENFSPRVMNNWGLGYETLKKIHPDLIMLSMSGFGQTGPWKEYVAYAPTVHALGGMTYMTAETEDAPLGPGFAYGDIMSGLFGAYAVLAALENRRSNDQGVYIDLSEYEVICALMGPTLLEEPTQGSAPKPIGNRDSQAAPCGCYPCRGEDRWCVVAAFTNEEWTCLCKVFNPSLLSDKRFETMKNRQIHSNELDVEIEKWTCQHSPQEVVDILQSQGVPSGVVQDARQIANDPQLTLQRFFFESIPAAGNVPNRSDVTPLLTQRTAPATWQDAPAAGEANTYVCRELLGMSDEEYRSYVKEGCIG